MANDVRAFVSFHDLKKKRGLGGGLSDGGLANVRESLTLQSVLIGPPPGKAWQGTPEVTELEGGAYIFNFDAVPANIEWSIVLEDGSELFPQTLVVAPGAVEPVEVSQVLTYPMQLKFRTLEAHTKRVLLAVLFTEFDVPSDLE